VAIGNFSPRRKYGHAIPLPLDFDSPLPGAVADAAAADVDSGGTDQVGETAQFSSRPTAMLMYQPQPANRRPMPQGFALDSRIPPCPMLWPSFAATPAAWSDLPAKRAAYAA